MLKHSTLLNEMSNPAIATSAASSTGFAGAAVVLYTSLLVSVAVSAKSFVVAYIRI